MRWLLRMAWPPCRLMGAAPTSTTHTLAHMAYILPPIHPSIHPSIHPGAYLPTSVSGGVFVWPSVCLSSPCPSLSLVLLRLEIGCPPKAACNSWMYFGTSSENACARHARHQCVRVGQLQRSELPVCASKVRAPLPSSHCWSHLRHLPVIWTPWVPDSSSQGRSQHFRSFVDFWGGWSG